MPVLFLRGAGIRFIMTTYDLISLASIPAEGLPLLLSLQGLANRNAPQVYLLTEEQGPSAHWVEWYQRDQYAEQSIAFDDLLRKYRSACKGLILYDPAFPDSINLAVTLAGLLDAWICPPSLAEQLQSLGITCLLDLRGKWSERVAAYRWLMQEALVKCNLSVLANFDQSGGTASPKPDMDYLIARRGFCMGLSINQADYPEEAACWEEVQTKAPPHAMMLGWHTPRDSEATHVFFGSNHNVHVYCGGAWNMSFHQHIPARNPYTQTHCQTAACDPKGKYVCLCLSDGDSWHSMVDVQKKFWLHPRRGEVPLGWQVAPVFSQVGPSLLGYYYESRTLNDYLLCGPSGIGYNYLSGFKDWSGYLELTRQVMQKTSLRTIWVINRVVRHLPGGVIEHRLKGGPIQYTRQQMEEFNGIKDQNGADWVDPMMVARYLEGLPDALGFFQGWERIPGESVQWLQGKSWSPTVALVRNDPEATLNEFEQAASAQLLPAFLPGHINCYAADMEGVIAMVRTLEQKGYTVVRPDVFLCLAADAWQRGLRA
jgi:hypothetical protein